MPHLKTYPQLKTILPLDRIPDNLGFLQEGIEEIVSGIFYNNLQTETNLEGDQIFYYLDLVTYNQLGFKIPGTEMKLIFAPDPVDPSISSFPVSFLLKWKLLKYFPGLRLSAFSLTTPRQYFDLLLEILNLDEEDILKTLSRSFASEETALNSIIDAYNTAYPLTTIDANSDYDLDQNMQRLLEHMIDSGQSIIDFVFTEFINDDLDKIFDKLQNFFNDLISQIDIVEGLKDILIPQLEVSINEIDLALEFPRNWLKPIYTGIADYPLIPTNPAKYQIGDVIDDPAYLSRLTFKVGSLSYSTETGFQFTNEGELNFKKAEIADTGLTLEVNTMKLDLSRTSNITEATTAGYADDFMGVFIHEVKIGLPKFWEEDANEENDPDKQSTAEIFGENLLIGTGGITGKLGLRTKVPGVDSLLATKFGGSFNLGLTSFDIEFKQNKIIGTNIKGWVTVPGFDDATTGKPAKIDVTVDIHDGNWKVSLEPGIKLTVPTPPAPPALPTKPEKHSEIQIKIPNILTFDVFDLTIGSQDHNGEKRYYIALTGKINFIANIGIELPKAVEIKNLKVYSDGSIELPEGGGIDLRKPIEIKIGPAKISITAITLGSHEQMLKGKMRKYNFFGFDGGLNVNPGGVDARASGLKFYYTVDGPFTGTPIINHDGDNPFDIFLRVESIRIDITIPGKADSEVVARIGGFLSVGNEDGVQEYAGGIELELTKPNIAASAAMRYRPSVPSFIIDIALDLNTPIPLGSTGVGIYGFRGLFGLNFVATKKAAGISEEKMWYDYYKAKVPPLNTEGVNVGKFSAQKGVSIGAGVSLATATDTGKIFSTKLFLMLTPGLFYLEGQAKIADERIKLSDTADAPFSLVLSIDRRSIAATIGVNLLFEEGTGKIVTVAGRIELAFFFDDLSAWYLNVGRDLPEDARVRANIFGLFDVWFYLMINSREIATGAGIKVDINKQFSGFGVKGGVFMEMHAKLVYKPFKVGASLAVGGNLSVMAFGTEVFSIEAVATLSGSAPRPIIICGSIKVTGKINLLVFKKEVNVNVELCWDDKESEPVAPQRFLGESGAQALNMNTKEVFKVKGVDVCLQTKVNQL